MTTTHEQARVRRCARLWEEFLTTPRPLDRWVSQMFKANRQFGSQDRAYYSDMLFSCARFGYLIPYLHRMEQTPQDHYEVGFFKDIGWNEVPVDKAMEWTGRLNGRGFCLEKALSSIDKAYSSLMSAGFPLWILPQWQRRIEASAWDISTQNHFLRQQLSQPPLWLRWHQTPLLYPFRPSVYTLPAYVQGEVEIQDWGSQNLLTHWEVKPGHRVLDCCAGAGGKTLQLADALQGRGVVVACDIRPHALEELKRRARRAGVFVVRTHVWDGNTAPAFFGREVRGGFDRVLVDAPCTGSGTWRRNPEAKLFLKPEQILEKQSLQLKLLHMASQVVKLGGEMMYATCSWFVEENEDVVQMFLKEHSEFELIEQKMIGSPHRDSDAFFMAHLRRKAEVL